MSSISLALLSFLPHLIILTAQQDDITAKLNFSQFIQWDCFDENGNQYPDASTYGFNLYSLLYSNLTSDPNTDYGFFIKSQDHVPDLVRAIGLCRGDITPDACRSCLHIAPSLLLKECPNQKEAMGYNDGCMLRYSNQSIFGSYRKPDYYLQYHNEDNATEASFNRIANDQVQNLTRKAAVGDSRRKFAASGTDGAFQEPVYGLVQCTPDLIAHECNNCWCKVVKLSCSVRYEKYPFYDINSLQPSPPSTVNATSSPGDSSRSRIVIISLAVLAVAFIIVLSSICAYSPIMKTKKTIEIKLEDNQDEITPIESLQFHFHTIRLATDNFSIENKLGQGGFRQVYKGRLSNGREIAVKRLSMDSGQGDSEFKNEVLLVAKLQHRNLAWKSWREGQPQI
ncbi:cysteine-rich receptor-like protein kinase 10 [Prosopis cineraria]|uniref:cysteine-rich receptor-like protein kinase 10 n=1 Tax=Prosopis cineraria TaxID=364024 RepID=UPI00241055E4|nr:cysteine-rich receptor-like protein kinase 10 [Prosopis cineraria]